jgi:hypothetical protein
MGNNVSSFAIDDNNGNLSLINSNASTCPTASTATNPEPCGEPLDILLDPTGTVAFVLNQGVPCADIVNGVAQCQASDVIAPSIYAYAVNSGGSLGAPTLAAPLPDASIATLVPEDTAIAMKLDAGGNFLYVITGGNQSLTPPLAPQLFVFSAKPGAPTLTPVANTVSALTKIPTALSAITFPTASVPCGAAASQDFLYVTNNHDLSVQHYDSTVSEYCVNSSGTLIDLNPQPQNPPYITQGDPLSVQAVNTSPAGQSNVGGVFVYVGSQPGNNAGTLGVFQMCTAVNSNGSPCNSQDVEQAKLIPVGTKPITTGQNPVAMVVDPTDSFLYVVCYVANQVWAYGITTTTGELTVSNPPNEATGLSPVAIALHPSVNNTGQFLYTSNSAANNITGLTLNTTTGAMSNPITVVAPETPSGMAAR